MGITDIWLFILAGLLLNVTPGPDMALVVARSSRQGARAGIAAALGVGAGAFVHIAAAAVGISALLMTSALMFTIVKWIGAIYLVYLGARMLWDAYRNRHSGERPLEETAADVRGAFVQGFLTNVFNPKVALFFLAFLPQFIAADAPSKALALVVLGLVFNTTGTLWNIAVALAAARMTASTAAGNVGTWLERVIGVLFIVVGIRLALEPR